MSARDPQSSKVQASQTTTRRCSPTSRRPLCMPQKHQHMNPRQHSSRSTTTTHLHHNLVRCINTSCHSKQRHEHSNVLHEANFDRQQEPHEVHPCPQGHHTGLVNTLQLKMANVLPKFTHTRCLPHQRRAGIPDSRIQLAEHQGLVHRNKHGGFRRSCEGEGPNELGLTPEQHQRQHRPLHPRQAPRRERLAHWACNRRVETITQSFSLQFNFSVDSKRRVGYLFSIVGGTKAQY